LISLEAEVRPEWIDTNGHMTFWAYLKLFALSSDAYLDKAGVGEPIESGEACILHTSQSHVKFVNECFAGETIVIELQLLGYDDKSVHIFQRMRNRDSGALLAVEESIKVNLVERKSGSFKDREKPFRAEILERLEHLARQDKKMPWPAEVGSAIFLPSEARN
jgi:acyl-CoA thioesterase FadM